MPRYAWLRPDGHNGERLRDILTLAREQRRDYVEFMLHSSELMAGGSRTFPTVDSIEALYADLEALFDAAQGSWRGVTLREYRDGFEDPRGTPPDRWRERRRHAASGTARDGPGRCGRAQVG